MRAIELLAHFVGVNDPREHAVAVVRRGGSLFVVAVTEAPQEEHLLGIVEGVLKPHD